MLTGVPPMLAVTIGKPSITRNGTLRPACSVQAAWAVRAARRVAAPLQKARRGNPEADGASPEPVTRGV